MHTDALAHDIARRAPFARCVPCPDPSFARSIAMQRAFTMRVSRCRAEHGAPKFRPHMGYQQGRRASAVALVVHECVESLTGPAPSLTRYRAHTHRHEGPRAVPHIGTRTRKGADARASAGIGAGALP